VFASIFYVGGLFIWGSSYTLGKLQPNVNYQIGYSGHSFTRLKEVKEVKNIDILFLGSSHTYRGFDTRIFSKQGLKTFNLGSSSQSHIQTQLLIKRYLDSVRPKQIIYEVYPRSFMIDGVESGLDIISNDRNDKYSLAMAFNLNHIKTYNTLVYAYMRDIFNLNKSFEEKLQRDMDTYVSGGYVERELQYFNPTAFPELKIELNDAQWAAFLKNIALIHEKNIEVLFVYAPISPSLYNSYSNNDYFTTLMKSQGTYYNFNEILALNDSLHFYDSHHLNQKGADIFNKELLVILNKK
jgi:hypothetical protein